MKGMLIKDLSILKVQKRFFLMVIGIALFLSMTDSGVGFIVSYLMFLFGMFTISTVSYDEMGNGIMHLMTLPVTRKQYVLSKYVFGLMLMTFAGAISIPVMLVSTAMTHTAIVMKELLFTVFITFGITMVFLSFSLPIQFKYGAEKGRIAMFITIGAIAGVVYLVEEILKTNGIDFMSVVSKFTELGIFVGALGIGAIAYVISMLISNKIIQNKEF